MNKLIQLDVKFFYLLNDRFKCNILDEIMPYITQLGSAFSTILICIMLITFGDNTIAYAGYNALFTLSITHLIVRILKSKVARPRPFNKLSKINISNTNLCDFSFPSGHTTASFSIAITLSLVFPTHSFIFILLAFIVGLSRIYLGVHYPSDVLVGILVSTFFSIYNYTFLYKFIIHFIGGIL